MSTIQRNAVTVTGQAHGHPLVFSHGYGCTDDVIAPAVVGAYVHEHLAGSTLVAMNATGHCPNLSAPAETIDAIRAFL